MPSMKCSSAYENAEIDGKNCFTWRFAIAAVSTLLNGSILFSYCLQNSWLRGAAVRVKLETKLRNRIQSSNSKYRFEILRNPLSSSIIPALKEAIFKR